MRDGMCVHISSPVGRRRVRLDDVIAHPPRAKASTLLFVLLTCKAYGSNIKPFAVQPGSGVTACQKACFFLAKVKVGFYHLSGESGGLPYLPGYHLYNPLVTTHAVTWGAVAGAELSAERTARSTTAPPRQRRAQTRADLAPSSRPSSGRAQCASIGLVLSACSYSSGSMLRPDTWLGLGLGSGSGLGLPDADIEPEGGALHGAGPKGQGCRRVRVKAAQAR